MDQSSSPGRASSPLTFAVLTVAVTAFALIQSLILPVLGGLAGTFGTDRSTITWLLTAYLLSASVCTPVLGRIGDAWGKERVLIGCLIALAVGGAVCALAPAVGWLIAGRAIQGAGGGILPVAFGIIRDEFPPARVPFAISFISSLLAFGIGCGVVLAGPLVDLLGDRALFWLPALVSAAAALAAHRFVPRSRTQSRERIGAGPAVGLAAWLVMLVLGVSQAPSWGWLSLRVIALLAGAGVALSVWIRLESRARMPLVDMRLMRRRGIWTANLVALLIGFGLYTSSTLIPQLAQTSPAAAGFGLGVSITESGLMMLPSCVVSFVVGIAGAPLAARWGSRPLLVLGSLVIAAGTVLIALQHEARWEIYVGASMVGFGTGLTMALLANLVVAAVPAQQTGVATGMNANIRTIGGAIGSAAVASVLASNPGRGGSPSESGYVVGLLVIAAAAAAAAAAALAIPRARTRAPAPPQPIYVVSAGHGVEQVFATREDAERFAGESPGARVSRHQVRRSVDEAVVIFDRRVVVAAGATVLDRTDVVRRFVDDPHDRPDPADVEWFHDARDSGWHIAGFGIDKAALDAKMQDAIDRVARLSHPQGVS